MTSRLRGGERHMFLKGGERKSSSRPKRHKTFQG